MLSHHSGLGKWMLLLCALPLGRLPLSAQERTGIIISDGSCPSTFCKEGVTAFRAARYEEAVQSFRKAVEVDPSNQETHLYLGTALAYQVVPNLQTPENLKTASSALSEFEVVLKMDPENLKALSEEAAIYRNIQSLEKAKAREKEVIRLDPKNAEAFYSVGVMDWTQAYKNSITVLAKEGLTDDGVGNATLSNAGCDVLEQQNAGLINDALTSLTEAIRLSPKYDDAMQYLNLIYRRRAEIHCHDRAAAETDVESAKQWSEQAMKARRVNQAGIK